MSDWDSSGTDRFALAVKLAKVLRLLAEAVWSHPEDGWARRAKQLVPNLANHFTPPCRGNFDERCDDYHVHRLQCFRLTAVCRICGKTNEEHRKAWDALK